MWAASSDPDAYFHFIHAFGNGRRSYASEPVAYSKKYYEATKTPYGHHVIT